MIMTMAKLLVLLTTISLVAPPLQSAVVAAFSTEVSKKSHINDNGHRRHRGAAPPSPQTMTTIAAITTPSNDGDGTSKHRGAQYIEHSRHANNDVLVHASHCMLCCILFHCKLGLFSDCPEVGIIPCFTKLRLPHRIMV